MILVAARARIVPGAVNKNPVAVQLHQIPAVVHRLARDHLVGDVEGVQQQAVGLRVALAHAPAVQQDALVNQNDDYYLYVTVDGETAQKRKVSLGKNVAGYYQILDGVKEDEKIIVEGMLTLADGGKIRDITGGNPVQAAAEKPAEGGRPE